MLAGSLFLTLPASAAESSITVIVPAACSLSTTSGSGETYNISMTNGQYKNDIGTTTLTAICNDKESLSIYAVGYSNDTLGNTDLIASNSSATNISTGTATSGDTSNWAMKVEAITGTGAGTGANAGINFATPTIENNYSNFSVVPNQQTKVATLPSVTETINSISVKSTYAVYASPTQAPSTYTGKVKYTVVYPASNLPVGPVTTSANKISYNPNANGVVDSMSDQSITSTDTSVTLWASNFKRKGYGFAGWSDKWDWELNQNDANGNGTGANTGYHIYGPNETITVTAGQYSGENQGLSLYAVWVPSQGTLQNWNGCSAMTAGQVTALTDNRDNDTYAVAKLADDNCWMIENLRLDNTPELTLANTNKPNLPLTNDNGSTSNHLSATSSSWCADTNSACIDQSRLNTENTISTTTNMTTSDDNIYSYGNYYNWYSVTAGTGTYGISFNNVAGSICPKGWHLPTGSAGGEVSILDYAMGGTGDYQYSSAGIAASKRWRKYPNNFMYSGIFNGSYQNRGSNGEYLSASSYDSLHAYELTIRGDSVAPGAVLFGKTLGGVARCVANEPTVSLEQAYANAGKTKYNSHYKMQDMNSSICAAATAVDEDSQMQAIDTRDNKLYWITKLQDGHCWMTQNLDLNLDANTTYTHADTDLGWGSDTATTTWKPTRSTIDATNVTNNSISGWSNDHNAPYSVDPGNWYWKNDPFYTSVDNNFLNNQPGDKFQKNSPFTSNGEHGHVGNYYNWSAAVAMNSTSSYSSNTSNNIANNPQNSICPAGWRLPTISNASTSEGSTNEFRRLNVLYNNGNSTSSSQNLEKVPLYFVRGGGVYSSAQGNAGVYGDYWSSSVYSSGYAYYLTFNSSIVTPEGNNSRSYGFFVRCVSR